MAKTVKETKVGELKKFTVQKVSTKKINVCKISIPLMRIETDEEKNVIETIKSLLEQATTEFPEATYILGTLTIKKA